MTARHVDFWPPHVPRHLTIPATSLWYNLEVSATRYPDKAATIFYDSVVSFAALKREAEALAGYLQRECGVKRGDRVALYLQNSPQFVIGYYAILRADAMVVPVNPMNMPPELAHILGDSGAKVAIVAQDLLPRIEPMLGKGLERIVVACYADHLTAKTDLEVPAWLCAPRQLQANVTTWADAIASGAKPGPHLAGPDDLCVMPYTSGTTGLPKGCVHRHRSVMYTTLAVPHWHRTFQDEVVLAVLPLFHVTGMQNSMNSPMYTGSTAVLLPRWDRDMAAKLVARHRVTGWSAIPTMIIDLLSSPNVDRYDLSSIRSMGGGGSAMPEAIAAKLQKLCGISFIEGYGLSETIAPSHINPPHKPKKQCLGIPIFDVDSRVVDPTTLAEVPPGESGEIVTSGPQVFDGYWQKPEANAACFVELDGKRFFRTGDLGRTDEEGYFYLVDRLKRMINVGGYKVWPAEVESMLYAHPAIQEAVVISRKDERRGETVKAVVVLKAGAQTDEASLQTWAREQMAAYKVPASFEMADSLPKSGSGKVLWRILQAKEDAGATPK